MIIKKIQYHDLDGDLREDDFYFSMNETQFARANAMFPGGLQNFAMKAAKDKNADDMFRVIDTLVREAYGERVANGFIKTAPNGQKLAEYFINTEAYDNLLLELMKSEDNLMNFLTGCLNTNARERVQSEFARLKEENKNNPAIAAVKPEQGDKPSLTALNK
jgi:hypothetical protein